DSTESRFSIFSPLDREPPILDRRPYPVAPCLLLNRKLQRSPRGEATSRSFEAQTSARSLALDLEPDRRLVVPDDAPTIGEAIDELKAPSRQAARVGHRVAPRADVADLAPDLIARYPQAEPDTVVRIG